jgi:hypothetical protein
LNIFGLFNRPANESRSRFQNDEEQRKGITILGEDKEGPNGLSSWTGCYTCFFIYLFQGAVKFLDLEACWISWHFLMFLSLVPTIGLSEHLQETLIIDGKTSKNDGFL